MHVEQQYTLAIYPFQHALSDAERLSRLRVLERRWEPWWRRLAANDSDLTRALDDTYFFLPYIRTLLFPETQGLPPGDAERQRANTDYLLRLSTSELAARYGADAVLRLTLDAHFLGAIRSLEMFDGRADSTDVAAPAPLATLGIAWADVIVMPQSVGFLVLKLSVDGGQLPAERLVTSLASIRTVLPPRIGSRVARLRTRTGEGNAWFGWRDLVDYLLQGMTETGPRVPYDTLEQFTLAVKAGSARRYTETEQGQIYGQVFWLYSYAMLSEPLELSASDSAFPFPHQQTLYELASCKHVGDEDSRPHALGLAAQLERSYIALWNNWQAMALPDRVFFLGVRASDFTRVFLPQNVENDYFPLYIFVMYQKLRLNLLAGELMRRVASLHRNLSEARKLWDMFTTFRNHYWFVEITFKSQGAELYRRFQNSVEVHSLYDTVSNEVSELRAYYEERAQRRNDFLLAFITVGGFVLAVPALVATLYTDDLRAVLPGPSVTLVVGYLLVIIAWLLTRLYVFIRTRY